jgi:DNA-binding transcriptional LysR family regulator
VEAVARLGTLRAAAEDMGVTPGAVSQQVILAERILSLALFDRRPTGMVPTAQGAEILALLRRGFADLAAAVTRSGQEASDRVTVSVAPAFAADWLIWRLPRFRAAYPDVKVRIDAELALVEPVWGEVDLCVRVGRGPWAAVSAERLVSQVIFPVCAPELAAQIRGLADLARVPVIRETRAGFGGGDWLGPEGRADIVPGDGPWYSDAHLCLNAAIAGEGVFLAFEALALEALGHGRLVEPFRRRHPTANSYWLIWPARGRMRRPVQAFAEWLKVEVAEAGLGDVEAGGPDAPRRVVGPPAPAGKPPEA